VGGNGGAIQICSDETNVEMGRSLNINAIGRTSPQELTCN
jgi:hypothetical protein